MDIKAPASVALFPLAAQHWLYPDLMRDLRERFGTRFTVLGTSSDTGSAAKKWLGPNDRFIDTLALDLPKAHLQASPETAFAEARRNESAYGMSIWRDLVQRDRSMSTRMLGVAPNTIFAKMPLPDELTVARTVNAQLAYFEELFAKEKTDLIVSMGLSMMEGVAMEVARRRNIAMTFVSSSRRGAMMFWSVDPLIGPKLHKWAYERIPSDVPLPVEPLVTPDGPRQRLLTLERQFGLKTIARRSAIAFADRGIYALRDIKARRWRRRPSPFGQARDIVRERQTFQKIISLSEPDLGKLTSTPFIFFPLAQEPEFTVQVRSREWNNQFGIIKQTALCTPPGYRIVIKEHSIVGRQKPIIFEELLQMPNIVMAHPGIPGVELVKASCGVMSLCGTSSLEAAQIGKRAIYFSKHAEYGFLPSMRWVSSPHELPDAVAALLAEIPEAEAESYRQATARFRKATEELSFDATGTIWFGHGNELLSSVQLKRATDLLCQSYSFQVQGLGAESAA